MKTSRWIIVLSLVLIAGQFAGQGIAAKPSDKDTVSIYVPPKPKPQTTTAPTTQPMMRVTLRLPAKGVDQLDRILMRARMAGKESKNLTPSACIRADTDTPWETVEPVLAMVVRAEFQKLRLIAGNRQVMITIPDLSSGHLGGRRALEPVDIYLWPTGKTGKTIEFYVSDLGWTGDVKTLGKAFVAIRKAAGKNPPAVVVWAHSRVPWKYLVEACARASEAGFKTICIGASFCDDLPSDLKKEPRLPPAGPKIPADWFKQAEGNWLGAIRPKMVNKLKSGKVKFYGTKGTNNHVVYVVDRSGSMLETFDQIRLELVRSIAKLNKHYDFHLIFFAGKAPIENPPRRLVPGDIKHKKQVLKFMQKITPEGATDPLPALKRAFDVIDEANKTKPDKAVIMLITDGCFPDNEKVLKLIAARNKDKSVVINTFLFCSMGKPDPEAVKFLKKIAADNGGKYKLVQMDE